MSVWLQFLLVPLMQSLPVLLYINPGSILYHRSGGSITNGHGASVFGKTDWPSVFGKWASTSFGSVKVWGVFPEEVTSLSAVMWLPCVVWCVTQLLNAHVSVAVAKRCHPWDTFGLHDGLPGHECGSGCGCGLERICFVSAWGMHGRPYRSA